MTAWRMETVSFRAAYGNERVTAYLFLPDNAKPPFQTVVYFPGSTASLATLQQHPGVQEHRFWPAIPFDPLLRSRLQEKRSGIF